MDITTTNPVESFSRFQSLEAGHYWRAIKAIPNEGIELGEVLLIESIRFVDNAVHTIILRTHPSKYGRRISLNIEGGTRHTSFKEHRFLTNEFLNQFEYEPDHQKIRTAELNAIQRTIQDLQVELLETQNDPEKMSEVIKKELAIQEGPDNDSQESCLPDSSSVEQNKGLQLLQPGTSLADIVGTGINEQTIKAMNTMANEQHQIATIQANWIQSKTQKIARTIEAMTPYYEEQAAASLARTEQVRKHISKLMAGIKSLDLYVGKDVEVMTINKGQSAPSEIPLTIVQQKLLVDEECSVYLDVDEWFDWSRNDLFFDELKSNDRLINQIFPSERCVVIMATTNRNIRYTENAMANAYMNAPNRHVYLMVRDGENLYRVSSPIESHGGASRLFPSKDDQDCIFKGVNGENIGFNDVDYTDRIDAHDDFALHYKRFLILFCGLDHRLKLFGDFYPGEQNLNFVTQEFQEQFFRFIHDADGEEMLPREKRMDINQWIRKKNEFLRSGSRVLCLWSDLLDPYTAPGACRNYDRRETVDYWPRHDYDVVVAYESKGEMFVDIEVHGETRSYEDRSFKCKVNLSRSRGSSFNYICLDAISPEDMHWYIHNRTTRKKFLEYMRLFKTTLGILKTEHARELPTRTYMADALITGQVCEDRSSADKIVDQAVITWRAYHRGAALPSCRNENPKGWDRLLKLMYMLAPNYIVHIPDIEQKLNEQGYKPLRLVLNGTGDIACYATPAEHEMDNRFLPHQWVHKITFTPNKNGAKQVRKNWTTLPIASACETVVKEWPQQNEWLFDNLNFKTFEEKQRLFNQIEQGSLLIKTIFSEQTDAAFTSLYKEWNQLQSDLNRTSRYVSNPVLFIPIGIFRHRRGSEPRVLGLELDDLESLLFSIATSDEARQKFLQETLSRYATPAQVRTRILKSVDKPWEYKLSSITLDRLDRKYSMVLSSSNWAIDGREPPDPSLDSWFERWVECAECAHDDHLLWLPSNISSSDGKLAVDSLLGIEPVDLSQVTNLTHRSFFGELPGDYSGCFDIHQHNTEVEFPSLGKGSSRSTTAHLNREAAILAMQEHSFELINATDVKVLPVPKEAGVERWYYKKPRRM